MTPRQYLENQLPLIERVISAVCRRRGIQGADADDLRQEVLLKLADKDCAALAGFRGESSLATFVTVVTTKACIDEIRRRRGRWRPSAVAQRLGAAATALEAAMSRDGLEYEEAVAQLVATGVVRSRRELDRVRPELPARPRRLLVSTEEAPELKSQDDPERQIQARERGSAMLTLRSALAEIQRSLPIEDRLILRRLFAEERSVAQVARELRIEQQPLYRRRDRLLGYLGRQLRERGLSWSG